MKIRFEGTIEHLVALNRYHYANSPTTRRQRLLVVWLVPGIFFLFALLLSLADVPEHPIPRPLGWIFIWCLAIFFAVLFSLLARWLFPRLMERNLRRLLAEGGNKTLLGSREMELVNNRLVVETELIYSRLSLRAIEKIVTDGDYTFVYIASIQAFIIPMNLYPEEEYREFVAELRAAWERRDEDADEPVPGKDAADMRITQERYGRA